MKHTRTWRFLLTMLILTAVVVFVGAGMIYVAERDINPGIHGIADALWLMVVSVSTVGYGDIHPVTHLGRLICVVVIFVGMGLMGSLTHAIAARCGIDPELLQIEDRLDHVEHLIEQEETTK